MSTMVMGSKVQVPFVVPATELAAGTAIEVIATETGFINAVDGIVQTAIVTGGALTFAVGTTVVVGASVTFSDSALKGDKGTVVAPTAGSSTRAVTKGQRIQIIPAAAFNGGGAVAGYVEIATGG